MAFDPEELFHQARAIASARERELYLAQACGTDKALKARIERLLAADERATGFLATRQEPAAAAEGLERPGDRIGRYKLLEIIGEGGFGSVWMAEQQEPVRRKVALKVLKPGMDSKSVLARFEAERQALALMEHPGIAKVLDGGMTEQGRPYFVMELVRGVPITRFCDDARMGIEARLELFVATCRALQHAHHKGVIHRDVKPSNILVTLEDGRPSPKVIDFGIAKALGAALTDQTLFTGLHQMLGTPEYMAPEQTSLGTLDIDTRADVYSLGVLLYELLTGTRPHDLKLALERGYEEVVRTIREEQPARPSTRASGDGDGERAAVLRATAPNALRTRLEGDLDWIALKALEKDRSRRYDTASALADDVERFLRDEPVLARPPSTAYQLSRFVKRHRIAVAATAAVFTALVAGLAASTHFALDAEARRADAVLAQKASELAEKAASTAAERAQAAERESQKRASELEQVVAFQERQLENIDAESVGLRLRESLLTQRREALERRTSPENERAAELAALETALAGTNFTSLAVEALDESIFRRTVASIDSQFADQPLLRANLLARVATALDGLGRSESAAPLRRRVLELRLAELGPEHELTLDARLQCALMKAETLAAQREELERVRDDASARLGADHATVLSATVGLAALASTEGRHADALTLGKAAVEGLERNFGADDLRTLEARSSAGGSLLMLGRYEEGTTELEASYAGLRRVAGETDRRTLACLHSLATAWAFLGRMDDALRELRAALALARTRCGDDHAITLGLIDNLAGNLLNSGRVEEAEPLFVEHVARLRRLVAPGDVTLCIALSRFGRLRSAQKKENEAVPLLEEAYAGLERALPPENRDFTSTAHNLGTALTVQRRYADAERVLRRAVEGRRTANGEQDLETVNSVQALATAVYSLGRVEEGFGLYVEAVNGLQHALGDDHDRTLRARRNLAVIALARKDYAVAAEQHAACVASIRRTGVGDGASLHNDLSVLGSCLLELQRWKEAEEVLRECLEIRERLLPAGNWARAYTRNLVGGALLGQLRVEEARELILESAAALAMANDVPASRPGQPDRVAESFERAARLLDELARLDPSGPHAAAAADWRTKAAARRPSAR
ncbi:MAG: serine/threonine-protein kinase [Planctomycetota bacterium]|nr:serine/threonine-protein kinase [Planctomycetota bacterium]